MPRTLLSDDGTTRVYEITDAKGAVVGTDAEPTGQAKTDLDNASAMRSAAIQAIQTLENADANWAGLSAAQKDAAQRLALRVTAKLVRLQFGRLEAS
jgi:hypothetical protein